MNNSKGQGRTDMAIDGIYEKYRYLRNRSPVLSIASGGRSGNMYLITRYQDVASLFRNPRVSKIDSLNDYFSKIDGDYRKLADFLSRDENMFRVDPPAHYRLRLESATRLSPKALTTFSTSIRNHVSNILDKIDTSSAVNVVDMLAKTVTSHSLCQVVGFPIEDALKVRTWTDELAPLFEGLDQVKYPKAVLSVVGELDNYIESFISNNGHLDDRTVLYRLLHPSNPKYSLTTGEIKSTIRLILMAGSSTSADFLSSVLYRLSCNIKVQNQLRRHPELIRNTIEEILRLDSPIQITRYYASEDLEVGPVPINRGAVLALCIGSANRDDDVWEHADDLLIDRDTKRTLSFGGGPHLCIGAGLVRLQSSILLEELLSRFQFSLSSTRSMRLKSSQTQRGFEKLELTFNQNS